MSEYVRMLQVMSRWLYSEWSSGPWKNHRKPTHDWVDDHFLVLYRCMYIYMKMCIYTHASLTHWHLKLKVLFRSLSSKWTSSTVLFFDYWMVKKNGWNHPKHSPTCNTSNCGERMFCRLSCGWSWSWRICLPPHVAAVATGRIQSLVGLLSISESSNRSQETRT